jgi:membrane-associated phospholipid phosphatase
VRNLRVKKTVRFGAPLAWLTGTTLLVLLAGVPTSRDVIYIWLGLGMAAFSATDLRRRLPRLLRDWAPLVAILFLYDFLRGFADGLLFHAHELPQIRLEEAIFGKPIPTVWLQQHLWHGGDHMHWWDYASYGVYVTHFVATPLIAALLWTFAHDKFARYATMVCVLAVTGFATYVLYPAVPPWMASQDGAIAPTTRTVGTVWRHIPVAHFSSLFENGQHYANNVAAMPSLHAAYALLVTLVLWRLVPMWARVLLAIYPLAMTFALVYSGEHYVIDCVAGWVYALFAYGIVTAVAERRSARVHRAPELEPAFAD